MTKIAKTKLKCGKGCGRGCTQAEYDLAVSRAAALVETLGADDWEPRVHENLGWHYAVRRKCDRIEVYEYWSGVARDDAVSRLGYLVPSHYSAFMNAAGKTPAGRWVGDGTTPQEAVADVISKAVATREEINAILEGLA